MGKVTEHDERIEKMCLKWQLQVDHYFNVAKLQAQVATLDVELTGMRLATSRSINKLEVMTSDHAS